jgi:cbb3-type cytochrome oxidase subunit 3
MNKLEKISLTLFLLVIVLFVISLFLISKKHEVKQELKIELEDDSKYIDELLDAQFRKTL